MCRHGRTRGSIKCFSHCGHFNLSMSKDAFVSLLAGFDLDRSCAIVNDGLDDSTDRRFDALKS